MSLTATDLQNIGNIFDRTLATALAPIAGELEAQGNDIKAIYSLLNTKQAKSSAIRQYRKLKNSIDAALIK
jgi:hypothetical protein